MSALTRTENRYNPLRDMEELHNRLNSLVNNAFGRVPLRADENGREQLSVAGWAPLVDITEDDNEYLIKVELPEVKKEDLSVTVENGVLLITGERKLEKEEKGRKFHRVERAYGKFARSFSLPDDADPAQVKAEFKHGILRVGIAKHETAKPRSIEVKIS